MKNRICRWVIIPAVLILSFGILNRALGYTFSRISTLGLLSDYLGATSRLTPKEREWIDKLAFCESGNRWDIKVLDSNDKYSYGGLQFQKETFLSMVEHYGLLREAEARERENFLMDKNTQIELAGLMLRDGGWRHWMVCSKKLGLDKEYPVKQLTQK